MQSTVNLLGNSSAGWNSQYLKKILRIPEDQLKILNSIPGWTSDTNSSKHSPSSKTSVNKDNQPSALTAETKVVTDSDRNPLVNKEIEKHLDSDKLGSSPTSPVNKDNFQTSSVVQTKATCESPKNLVVGPKEIEKHLNSIKVRPFTTDSQKNLIDSSKEAKKCLEDTNENESFPLRKSSSLSSVSIPKANLSCQTLKRSSSTSDLKEKTTESRNTSLDALNFNPKNKVIVTEKSSLSNIEEVEEEEMQVDVDRCLLEKSNFSNSGVQCKMSQDLLIEPDPSQPRPIPYPAKRGTLKSNAIASTNQMHEQEIINKKLNLFENKNNYLAGVGLLYKESLNEKSKIDVMSVDESYFSLSVPCAQPPSENTHPDKELENVKESACTSQNKYFSSTSKDVQSPLDNSFHASGKRKRKSRQERSKKHRGVNADSIKIEYSSEQIKNMIELMKNLNKY